MNDDISVVHLDAWLAALNKPSGLLSVCGKGPENRRNLTSLVQQRLPGALNVHRLDRDTSGVIVMALDPATHRSLSELFAARRVAKRYVAVVEGRVRLDEGVIDLPLAKDFERPPRHGVNVASGKAACTHYRVLAREIDRTRLELRPLTGRSHQLRVHLRELGHPILGDPLYGDSASAERLLLHAEQLSFEHPRTRAELTLIAPCPF